MYTFLCAAYFVVLFCLAMYGLHRSHLVLTVLRHRKKLRAMRDNAPTLADYATAGKSLPHVTVQLPLYNEATVATRLLDHVVNIRYPRELFEIQVLDDSTDETRALVRSHVAELVATDPSLDIAYIHRV